MQGNPFALPDPQRPGQPKAPGKTTLLHWLYEKKAEHPDKVLLCRVSRAKPPFC